MKYHELLNGIDNHQSLEEHLVALVAGLGQPTLSEKRILFISKNVDS